MTGQCKAIKKWQVNENKIGIYDPKWHFLGFGMECD